MLILCSNVVSAAAKDPFVVHKGSFGPDFGGLQLGKTFKDWDALYKLFGQFLPNNPRDLGASSYQFAGRNYSFVDNIGIPSLPGDPYYKGIGIAHYSDWAYGKGGIIE
jgi:hypothetical protein